MKTAEFKKGDRVIVIDPGRADEFPNSGKVTAKCRGIGQSRRLETYNVEFADVPGVDFAFRADDLAKADR